MERNERTKWLYGEEGLAKLRASHVLVAGVGGVGGHCAEALARGGIGKLTVVDGDEVSESNMNRQLIATLDTIGKRKVQAMKERLSLAAPDTEVYPLDLFISPDTIDAISFSDVDFVVDAVDNVTAKLLLIERCYKANIPIISCMGTGNKLDGARLRIDDIFDTSQCPLARVMRREVRARGIRKLNVLWSDEPPRSVEGRLPGSTSYVPAAAGLLMAGYVLRNIGLGENT